MCSHRRFNCSYALQVPPPVPSSLSLTDPAQDELLPRQLRAMTPRMHSVACDAAALTNLTRREMLTHTVSDPPPGLQFPCPKDRTERVLSQSSRNRPCCSQHVSLEAEQTCGPVAAVPTWLRSSCAATRLTRPPCRLPTTCAADRPASCKAQAPCRSASCRRWVWHSAPAQTVIIKLTAISLPRTKSRHDCMGTRGA